jgi:predicted nucleic acid-binding protein
MSGEGRYLLDTNAIVSFLGGNRLLSDTLDHANWVGISIVSYLEFLAFEELPDCDRDAFMDFCGRIEVLPLTRDDDGLLKHTLDLRARYRLKLPDAIIGATALSCDAALVTSDTDFVKVSSLTLKAC